MNKDETNNRIDELAQEVLRLSRNTLLVNLRFLDRALSQFRYVPCAGTLATDGESIFYDAKYVLQAYKDKKERSVREYLHMVMHCIFRHNFIHALYVEQEFWDLACDIAVENVINELNLDTVDDGRSMQQSILIGELKKKVPHLTAEKLYRYFLDRELSADRIDKLHKVFRTDDHAKWYEIMLQINVELNEIRIKTQNGTGLEQDDRNAGSDQANTNRGDGSKTDSTQAKDSGSGDSNESVNQALSERERSWQKISERMQMDLESFQKSRGDAAGGLMQNLREINREKYDYSAFLRQFAVLGEAMKINDDEFDYNFYTYGLKLFRNMPLIEPLEYKDVKKIREFVIAIDTSGSVMGDTVQRFLQKTYNVFKQEESFFRKFNIHIIQCDAEIQEDARITNQEEFDAYISNMTIKGLGGTDFQPVFRYVDRLIEKKEFINLKGLIYFTDGCGRFPERKPGYNTAFVFLDDEYNNYDAPSWAIKLILQREEI